jgi:hypothetical protein
VGEQQHGRQLLTLLPLQHHQQQQQQHKGWFSVWRLQGFHGALQLRVAVVQVLLAGWIWLQLT